MSPEQRLFDGVLASGELRGYRVFFGFDDVVCFTECTPAGVTAVIRETYEPWGVPLRKTSCSRVEEDRRSRSEVTNGATFTICRRACGPDAPWSGRARFLTTERSSIQR